MTSKSAAELREALAVAERRERAARLRREADANERGEDYVSGDEEDLGDLGKDEDGDLGKDEEDLGGDAQRLRVCTVRVGSSSQKGLHLQCVSALCRRKQVGG